MEGGEKVTKNVQMSLDSVAGKYLTFQLAAEEYGLEILKVQEIIGIMDITRVPRMPGFIRGVINLRGKVIPVIDLRRKFGMESQEDTDKTCIIVVQIAQKDKLVTTGIIVDEVSEVLDISEDQIEDAPSFGADIDTEFILAMGKVGQKVLMFLEIDKVLSNKDFEVLEETSSEA